MQPSAPESEGSNVVLLALYVYLLYTLVITWRANPEPDLSHVPTVSHTNAFPRLFNFVNYLFNAPSLLQKGYQKHYPELFKIFALKRYLVIATAPPLIEEIRKAPEDILSFKEATQNLDSNFDFLGQEHAFLVREAGELTSDLSRCLPLIMHSLHEEILVVLKESIPIVQDFLPVWKEVGGVEFVARLVVGVNLRAVLGEVASRDGRLVSACVIQAKESFQTSLMSKLLPNPIRSLQAFLEKRRLKSQLSAVVQASKAALQLNNNEGQPTNILSWMVKSNQPTNDLDKLVSDFQNLLEAIDRHLSLTLTHALYHLAANPKYACPMRKEIEAVVFREGWTKSSLDKMRKLDSFIKESLRLSAVEPLVMLRKIKQEVTFSSTGQTIPQGALLCVSSQARHLDGSIYTDAPTFDGFRFSKLHEQTLSESESPTSSTLSSSSNNSRYQLTATTPEYLVWGYGPHACPGRFYASGVLKMMLAHVVLGYDIRFEDGRRPRDGIRGLRRVPGGGEREGVKVLVRKR